MRRHGSDARPVAQTPPLAQPYLELVRGGGDWSSGRVEAALEWRPDVADAMEVSIYRDQGGPGEAAAAAAAAQAAAKAAAGRGAPAAGGARAGAGTGAR